MFRSRTYETVRREVPGLRKDGTWSFLSMRTFALQTHTLEHIKTKTERYFFLVLVLIVTLCGNGERSITALALEYNWDRSMLLLSLCCASTLSSLMKRREQTRLEAVVIIGAVLLLYLDCTVFLWRVFHFYTLLIQITLFLGFLHIFHIITSCVRCFQDDTTVAPAPQLRTATAD